MITHAKRENQLHADIRRLHDEIDERMWMLAREGQQQCIAQIELLRPIRDQLAHMLQLVEEER